MATTATMKEQGNGFADEGDYAPGDDGELYRIISLGSGRIETGAPGQGNRIYGVEVELADWSDCEEEDVAPVYLVLDADGPAWCPCCQADCPADPGEGILCDVCAAGGCGCGRPT